MDVRNQGQVRQENQVEVLRVREAGPAGQTKAQGRRKESRVVQSREGNARWAGKVVKGGEAVQEGVAG